jgi:hypothetical protein
MWVSHFLNFKHSTASLSSLGRTFECSQKQMPGGEGCSEFWNRAMHRVGEAAARLQSLCIQLHQKCLGNRSFWNLYYLFKIQAFSFPPLFSPGLFVFCHSFSNMCVSVCVCVCVCVHMCCVFLFPPLQPSWIIPNCWIIFNCNPLDCTDIRGNPFSSCLSSPLVPLLLSLVKGAGFGVGGLLFTEKSHSRVRGCLRGEKLPSKGEALPFLYWPCHGQVVVLSHHFFQGPDFPQST